MFPHAKVSRREFLAGAAALGVGGPPGDEPRRRRATLFLAGDVMTGRGIDQALPQPLHPRLHEPYVKDARRYLDLAEAKSGPIPVPVEPRYIWGAGVEEIDARSPDARIVNLETAVTFSDDPWPGKGIHYRMSPDHVGCLTAARIDACVLGNNHVLDWGRDGLLETLETLHGAGLRTAGAGRDLEEARAPAVLPFAGGRVLVLSFAATTSGVPPDWAAGPQRPGVNLLEGFAGGSTPKVAIGRIVDEVAGNVEAARRPGDVVVASIHWGGNWGYDIPARQRELAHGLVETAGVDVVHGHSSHHPKGIEVHRGRPILYGCGDLINDYEGIGGHERFRPELSLLYFVTVEVAGAAAPGREGTAAEAAAAEGSGGGLVGLEMVPMRMRRFRLERPAAAEVDWLRDTLDQECSELGAGVEATGRGATLELRW